MQHELIAVLLEEVPVTLNEVAISCTVSREWVIEHVQAGVLLSNPESDPDQWRFSGRDLLRARRLLELERQFDANPELAGLVVDLSEELDLLRSRLRRLGVPDRRRD
jgi:chaperone modulatory protein CbpM